MKMRTVLATAVLLVAAAVAQEKGNWRAASKTARSITGDLAFGNEKVAINFSSFAIAQIRPLTATEIGAVFDADNASAGTGNLYRVSIPGTRRFVSKNTICGADETQWMATYVLGKDLQVAFFSGATMPVMTMEAIANTSNLCGTFGYVK